MKPKPRKIRKIKSHDTSRAYGFFDEDGLLNLYVDGTIPVHEAERLSRWLTKVAKYLRSKG